MTDVYLHEAVRTPRGKARPDGGLAAVPPIDLVAQLVDALEAAGRPVRALADGLVLGCVGQVGAQGGHVGLLAKLHAGLADRAFAHTVNNYCASGLTAIGQAADRIAAGGARRLLAGGVESMSQVPFMADGASYYADASWPARTRFLPVALAADRLAEREGITRAQMDHAALTSQARAAAAEDVPALVRSRIPVTDVTRARVVLAKDELVRPGTTAARLAELPGAFAALAPAHAAALEGQVLEHRHTTAHAPPMADGAGLAWLGGRDDGGGTPRAKILAHAEVGGDPAASLLAGFAAMDEVLRRAGLGLGDLDAIELMEAFGVTIARFLRDATVDPARVNVAGGHLAKGHPLGATGAILVSTLLDVLDHVDGTLGLVVATGAGGVGAALLVERVR